MIGRLGGHDEESRRSEELLQFLTISCRTFSFIGDKEL